MSNKSLTTHRPMLYIIAGPNGAGKTTFARRFLPHYAHCVEFINADYIAGGLSPFAPEKAAIRAGKIMLSRFDELAERGETFGFETTLAGTTLIRKLKILKARGYKIHCFFLRIESVRLALDRIADRVRAGGHRVPEGDVRRRFEKGLINFFGVYRPLFDTWSLFENSEVTPRLIASKEKGGLQISDKHLYSELLAKGKKP